MSQDSTISQPPATAAPFTAAISGLLRSRFTSPAKPPRCVERLRPFPAETSFRSAPAQNTVPLERMMPTQSSESFSSWSMAASMPFATSPFTALRASGLSSVMISTRPRTSVFTAMICLPLHDWLHHSRSALPESNALRRGGYSLDEWKLLNSRK